MIGYYYCSLSTFLNIIRNRYIYLSNPLKMNDNLEIKWYLNKLKNKKINSDHKPAAIESIFDMMKIRSGIDFTIEELQELLEYKGQRSVYISCFSKNSDILSQWRAYAEDGRGVSIGFNLTKLSNFDNLLIREVIYTDDVVYDDVESDLEIVSDTISSVIREKNITNKDKQIEIFLHELIPELVKYKNPAFAEEKEIRLIYCDNLMFENIINSHNLFKEPWKEIKLVHDFRTIGNDKITEFVRLEFSPETIEEICIGPKCLLSKNDVRNITKNLLGTDIKVKKSESSYR